MPPVWRERMFSSIFLEPYLDDVDSEQPPPPIGEAIDFVHDLLRQLCADYPMDTALRSIAELCADAEKLHPLRFDSLGSSRTLDFLSAFIQRVQRLRVGDVMLTPGCWSACSGTLFVLGRPSRSSNSDYTLAVCCTGSGAKYHPTHPCLLDGRMQRAVTLWLHGLAAERVCDSSFWFALFHTISTIQTQPQLSWSLLYERVLPYVAQRPLSDFFPSTAGSTGAPTSDSPPNSPVSAARAASTPRWRTLPASGHHRSFVAVVEALRVALLMQGEHRNPDAERMELLVRFQMLRRVSADLSSASELPRSEQLFIKGSVSQLVNSLGNGLRSRDWPLRISKATMEDMLSVASEVYQKLDLYDISLPPLLQLGKLYAVDQWPAAGATSSSCLPSGADIFPFFESLRRDAQAIEAAAGVAARLPIVRPVQFTAVPESVWSFEGACDALRQCVAVCTSLSNQAAQIKNSYGLRLTLISHLFTRVLPVPLPVSDSQRATRCLWANEKTPMRAEVQVELISNLSALSAHFAAVSLALAPSRQLDSLRVLTATAIAVIADSVLRIRAVVSPSTLSMHYAGLASGPLHPFGFNAAELLKKETATISLTDPSLALTRAALLEYFYSQRHWLRADHTLFSFERTMSFGEADALFVEQLALQVGLPSAGPLLPRYFSGEEPDLIDQLPELAMLRDIVFLFKAVLCPSADALPEPRAWKPRDAKLRWEHAADKGFSVRGFGDSPLKCCAYIAGAQERGFIKWTAGVASWFGRTERPRVPPSDSDPTTAVRRLGSEKEHRECVLNSEEDVLHVRALPDFEGRLGGHACELLLSYMTVPYLRIPLVLQLLSHSSRLPALASPDLQSIVDAILFEPGEWCTSEEIVSPERVPVGAGSALPTSCGLLFNELAHSPGVVLRAICEMLDGTLELDVGFFDPRGPSVAIMYALRLAVRVEEYAQYLERLTHNSADAERQLPAGKAPFAYPGERPAKVGSGGAPELSGLARVLGERLSISAQARAELVQGRLSIREKLDGTVVSMLRGWFSRAVREQQVEIACTVRAHLAYLHRNEVAGDLDRRAVATILVSQVFLSTNFEGFASLEPSTAERRQTSDAEANERSGSHGLLIDALEMHQLFQRHRASVLEWLESESESTTGAKSEGSLTSQVLEALMHVVSNGVNAGQAELTLTEHHLNPRPVDVVARQWVRMGGDANRGRFVPAAEEDLRLKREIGLLVEQYTTSGSFEEWLWQTTTAAADTEVNAQTGEFTLRRNQVQLLSDKVQRNPDFVAATSEVFGKLPGRRRLHCAQLSHTQHRHWVRLVGTEFDVQVWAAPLQTGSGAAPLAPKVESSSSFPSPLSMWNWVTSVLSGVPAWAEQLLRHAKELLPGVSLSLVAQSEEFGWVRATCLDDETHKEVVLFRLGVVHIFVNEEFGRHPQRRLIYTSNSRLSLHIPRPTQQCRLEGCDDRLQCGDPSLPAVVDESVVVKKRLGPERLQTYVPRRFLHGLLPDALIEAYQFWQDDDSTICGLPRPSPDSSLGTQGAFQRDSSGDGVSERVASDTMLLIELASDAQATPGVGAIIRRVPLRPGSIPSLRERDQSRPVLRMLCLLCVPRDSPLDRLRELVLRMEDLSHVLVWSLDEPSTSAPEVHRVELPRLALSFCSRPCPANVQDSVADDGDDDIRSSLERRSEHSTRLRSSSSLSDVRANAAPASAASIGAQTSASYGANEKDDTAMDSDPVEPRDGWRLYSEEHPTLFISDHRGPLVESHLRGLPHAVLLQDELGSFFVLLPATAKPFFLTHATRAGGRDRSLVLHRGDKQLLSSLGAVRHHLCPIHPSGAFMTTPTLAAALHLLLMRLLHAQYPEAVALAPVCAHDGELSLEERRIFQNLELTNFDSNPDAHALRLHISLAARDTAFAELCPWNIATELQAYVLKFIHVSAACRVPLRGELVLLRTLDHPTQRLVQRATLVQAILAVSSAEDQGSQRASGYLMPAPPPSSSEACFVGQFFDVHRKPKGASSSDGFSYQEKTWTDWLPEKCLHLYSPPPSGVGLPALEYFNRVLSGSLSLSQHFLLLYELLTGCIDTRPLSTDNTHNWGAMLVWMLSPADAASESLFMETLRLLLRSPHLCRRAPRYEREHVKEQRSIVQQIRTYVLGSGDVKDRFLEAVRALQLHEHTAEDGESESAVDDGPQSSSTFRPTIIARKRPAMRMELAKGYDAPAFLPVPETRLLTVARGEDFRNDTVQLRVVHHLNQAMKLSEKELQALTGCLLQLTAERAVTHLTRSERGLTPLPSDLPFDMRQHPMFEAQVAQRTFKRLSDDVAFFAAEQNHATVPRLTWLAEDVISSLVRPALRTDGEPPTSSLATTAMRRVQQLRRSLLSILRADMGFISRGSPEIVKFANDADLPRKREKGYEEDLEREWNGHKLLREGGGAQQLSLSLMLRLLTCSHGGMSLKRVHPYLNDKRLEIATNAVLGLVLRSGRIVHTRRCLQLCDRLLSQLARVINPSSPTTPLTSVPAPSHPEGAGLRERLLEASTVLAAAISQRRHCTLNSTLSQAEASNAQASTASTDSNAPSLATGSTEKGRVTRASAAAAAAAAAADAAAAAASRASAASVQSKNSSDFSSPPVLLEPRLLLFEFNCGIILREEQVRLVGKFVNSLRRGEPLCHQMIMGAGKTTVIAPLLALLLADGSTLVLQVVPASLVHFSRAVFWRAFSGMTMPKPVFTFLCDRSTQILPSLLASLERARDSSGVVLAAPTALKSFALKFLELTRDYAQVPKTNRRSGLSLSGIQRILGPGRLFGDADSIKAEYEQQLFLCSRILRVMNTGALMLDEVDWVLHPLKSELNWPLGEREPLDFSKSSVGSGLRWKLPFQMIDTILLAAEGATTADPEMPISKESQACIEALENAFAYGRDRHELQDVPHFLLLQRRFYDDSLLPVLARWSAEWLVQMGVQQVDREMLLTYLSSAARDELPKAAVDSMRRALQDEQFKLINLCHNWLHSLLPHVLSKRNRVAYGLLLPHNLSTGTSEPLARKLLAVPFVGKDCPSDSSQFSHPDVVIGLTVLAYRYEGLRFSDFKQLLKKLKDKLNDQLGPYKHRGASITFCKWVAAVGLQVRGAAIQDNSRGRRSTASARYSYGDNVGANASSAENSFEVPPLHLVDLDDVEQMNQLYHSLRLLPLLIHQYLNDTVFPSTMAFPSLKLSASGQELGGDLLFGMRLGFSGTLSDLLPEELGHCHFERGDDARMLHVLTDASVMSHEVLDAGWDARSILRRAATAEPPLHALIDTGALVSGFTNVEAARFLLQEGLRGMQACVFLDESGQKMVLMRDGLKLLRLDRCGVGVENRFTFFDHIHTTGTDVEQPPHARSALTLSKDVTFRDLAQGAFRMRGIGAGQTVLLFMPPGVLQLLREQAALGSGDTLEGREQWLRRLSDFDQRSQLLRDMCAWAVMNSVSSEQVQLRLLCQQSQRNVWRKAAFRRLLADVGAAASANAPTGSAEHSRLVERTNRLLDVFCERLAHDVLNTIPQLQTVRQQQEREVKLYSDILADCGVELSADDRLTLSILRERAINASLNSQSYTKLAVAERDFSSEQVQEQEVQQEVEHQQEQMREEEQKVAAPDTFPKERWDREADDVDKWNLADLRNACADSGGAPGPSAFYPAFKLSSSKMKATGTEPLFFPSFMMVSHNWARRNPSAKPRRLKNVSIVLDWVPDTAALLLTTQGLLQTRHELSDAQEARLREAFTMFDRHGNGILDVDDVIQVLRAVDVVLPHTSTSKLSSEIRRSSAREDDSRGAESASKLVGRFLTRPRSLKSLHSSQSLGETSAHLAARGDLKAEQIEDVAAIIRLIDSDKDGQISYDELREALLTHAFYRLSTGRYQVAVSLAEAETIRFALHAQARASGGRLAVAPNSEIALLHEGQLLDSTSGFRSGGSVLASAASGNTDYLGAISRQCWRFINSELDYDPEASSMLLRALQSNSMAERLAVFHALRHCRRRPAVDWKQFSIARLFTTEDEFKILHLRAMLSRTRLQIRQRRLLPSEFVALCDNDNDGIISYSELHSAIRWLGIDLSTEQVCELIDHLDLRPPTDRSPGLLVNHLLKGLPDVEDGADLLDWEEEEDDGSRSARARRIVIPQLPVYASPNAPLVDRGISPLGGLEQAPAVSDATLSHIMAKIKPVSEFEKLWDTVGTMSRSAASIWMPITHVDRTSLRVCLGCYASPNFDPPHKQKKIIGSGKESLLELSDVSQPMWRRQQSSFLVSVVQQFLLPPVRLTQIWCKRFKGQRQLYVWEAVPPEGFVALGMICSTTEVPPPVESMRCVPLSWVRLSTLEPEKLWDDAGSSGAQGSIWIVNRLRLIAVTPGHNAPSGPFYDLKWDQGILSQLLAAEIAHAHQ